MEEVVVVNGEAVAKNEVHVDTTLRKVSKEAAVDAVEAVDMEVMSDLMVRYFTPKS
jgi:hypothetical protein